METAALAYDPVTAPDVELFKLRPTRMTKIEITHGGNLNMVLIMAQFRIATRRAEAVSFARGRSRPERLRSKLSPSTGLPLSHWSPSDYLFTVAVGCFVSISV